MWLSKYFVDFVIFSFMGWIYETIFCTIKNRKWANRGFLYGPICPIYGAGAIACEILVDLFHRPDVDFQYTWWQIFIVSFLGSIVLEYATSWALEKLFHAYWWDYSDMPLNIKGRVCLPCSIGFGLAGILVVYVILPFTDKLTGWMTPITAEFISLLLMAMVAIDTTLTVSALTQFAKSVEAVEAAWNLHMENFVQAAATKIAEEREHFSKERLEQAYASMGIGTRSALYRVQGFRPRKWEKKIFDGQKRELTITARMNNALSQLKNRISNKNK